MVWQFSLDKVLNPYYPPSVLPLLPASLARWLGHRPPHRPPKPQADYLLWLDIMIGTFAGLLTVEAIFKHSTVFRQHNAPILVASYGATAILLFNVNQVPLAQPRNIIFGQFLSALVGVIILKLFDLSKSGEDHLWIGAALSTSIASVVMTIFGCVHPPSGATALIPLIDPEIAKMGWWYLPVQLVSSVVIVGVGLITNNVLRRYPVYWWTSYVKVKAVDDEDKKTQMKVEESNETIVGDEKIVITKEKLIIPDSFELSEVERQVLSTIRLKMSED